MRQRIVLGYSGDADSILAISWLAERHDAEVVAVCVDIGQGLVPDELRTRALAAGAVRVHFLDAQEEFAREHLLPALKAGAGLAQCQMAARPLIARKLLEIAGMERAVAVAHASSRWPGGESFDAVVRTLDPTIRILAPAREWADARPGADASARRRGVSVSPENARQVKPAAVPAHTPASVEIDFVGGVPVAVNGVAMRLGELLECVATIAAGQGVEALAPLRETLAVAGAMSRGTGVVRARLHHGVCRITSPAAPAVGAPPGMPSPEFSAMVS